MRLWYLCGPLALAFVVTLGGARACEPTDIAILQFTVRPTDMGAKVLGEIENRCAAATGVQLQAVFRDAAGKVAHVDAFWPASTQNIPAGGRFAFEHSESLDGPHTAAELHVIATRRWREDR